MKVANGMGIGSEGSIHDRESIAYDNTLDTRIAISLAAPM